MRKNACVLGVHHPSYRKSTGQGHDIGRMKRSVRGVVFSAKGPAWSRHIRRLSPDVVAAIVATRKENW